jgi:hypothetical protein
VATREPPRRHPRTPRRQEPRPRDGRPSWICRRRWARPRPRRTAVQPVKKSHFADTSLGNHRESSQRRQLDTQRSRRRREVLSEDLRPVISAVARPARRARW